MAGKFLRNINIKSETFSLKYLLEFYKKSSFKNSFFKNPDFFDKLAGTDELRKQIINGLSEDEIRQSWANDLKEYKKMRKKYLLYEDFK